MKVMLIKPGIGDTLAGYRIDDGRMEPLQLGIIAALTPPDVDVVLYDDRVEQVPFDARADLVAITVDSITARRAYAISDQFRARGVPVVLGGIHVTLVPEEASRHADAIVVGEAEPVWGELMADAMAGRLRHTYAGPFGEPQKGVIPRHDHFQGKGCHEIQSACAADEHVKGIDG